jgi:hypothetical protein
MPIGAKILAGLAGLCFLVWAVALALGVQPLFRDADIEVLYGQHEEFRDDGTAYRKFRNPGFVVVNLPEAPPERRWWTIDFRDMTIRKVSAPRSLSDSYYVMKGDLTGSAIGNDDGTDPWRWRIEGTTASFANKAFTCRVRRITSK